MASNIFIIIRILVDLRLRTDHKSTNIRITTDENNIIIEVSVMVCGEFRSIKVNTI